MKHIYALTHVPLTQKLIADRLQKWVDGMDEQERSIAWGVSYLFSEALINAGGPMPDKVPIPAQWFSFTFLGPFTRPEISSTSPLIFLTPMNPVIGEC